MVRLNLQMFAKSTSELAKEVIQGKYGNGQARKDALGSRYAEVQAEVNRMMKGGSSSNTTTQVTSAATNTLDTPKTTKPDGADQSLWDKANETWEAPEEINKQKAEVDSIYGELKAEASKEDIVSQDVYDAFNTPFAPSETVLKAKEYLDASQAQINSGKTQYTDRFNTALDNYLNREDFEYDVDKDPLFQQALASAMNSGKSAMQDTIGQASALTGGYGSTYATTAGNQAYNAFIEDAYNNLPEYYQMALEAYQAEGQELYNQVALLGDADANEWQKIYTQYQVNSDNYWKGLDFEYGAYQDNITNMYNKANLQLSEHGQKMDDLSTLYDTANDMWKTSYENAYKEWSDGITQALEMVNTQVENYWQNKNFNESARQFDQTFKASYEDDGNGGYQPKGSKTDSNSTLSLSDTEYGEIKKMVENGATEDEVLDYLAIKGKVPTTEEDDEIVRIAMYGSGASGGNTSSGVNADGTINWKNVDIEMVDDTMNGFLGLGALVGHYDTNDKVKVNGTVYETEEIHNMLDKDTTLSKTEKELLKQKIRDLSEGEVYNFSKKNSK